MNRYEYLSLLIGAFVSTSWETHYLYELRLLLPKGNV